MWIPLMTNGWVKLHLQSMENEIWQKDRTAWHIFEYLLFQAYADKNQPPGRLSTTRQQIANACLINNQTVFNALMRLKRTSMITTSSTTKYTLVSICNWEKYQSSINSSINNQMDNERTSHQQSYKNKELRVNKTIAESLSAILGVELGDSLVKVINQHSETIDLEEMAQRLIGYYKKKGVSPNEPMIKRDFTAWVSAAAKQKTSGFQDRVSKIKED